MSQKEIDYQFSNLRDTLDSLEKTVSDSMNQLSSQNNLVPIQSIKIPYLNNCKVRECESTNWSRYKYIRFDVPKECITVLNSQNIGIHGDDVRDIINLHIITKTAKVVLKRL